MSISIRSVDKHFGHFHALDDISLDIQSGELIALLGPSGCGKTTLLRMIAGLEMPDRGEIYFGSQNMTHVHVRDRGVGFVFQHYALFKHMTVFDNVAFGLRMRPKNQRPSENDIRQRVMELLDLVQLAWVEKRYPAQLSGGQRQRIALARALAVGPQVLLLDEPFGALDAKVRKELRRWLRNLHHELDVTSIFVTHDQEEALEVADRVVLINRGRIEQVGTPEQVWSQPATPFVYGFLGDVNRFDGRTDASGALQWEGGLAMNGGSAPSQLDAWDFQQPHVADAKAAAYVRPHDLEVLPFGDAADGDGWAARLVRAVLTGAVARLECELLGDHQTNKAASKADTSAASPRVVEVHVSAGEFAALALQVGDVLRLRPRKVRVFVDEGAGI